ncbi:hypothetical protein IDH20_03110 [Pelagibacterales bacterium SAG-MED39]|nr:hypothetical protein [Pelagibacterales bacterium SAG-MED39]
MKKYLGLLLILFIFVSCQSNKDFNQKTIESDPKKKGVKYKISSPSIKIID